jgi:hypothetical protein
LLLSFAEIDLQTIGHCKSRYNKAANIVFCLLAVRAEDTHPNGPETSPGKEIAKRKTKTQRLGKNLA